MASSIEWINSMNQISKELIRWIKLFLKVSRDWLLRAPVELINRMKMSEQRWFYVSFMSPVRSTVDASKKRKRNRRDRNWNAGGIFELFCGGMMMVFLYCNLIFHRVAGSGDEGRERMGREWGGVEGSAGRRTPPLSAASWWKITALFPRRFPMLLFFSHGFHGCILTARRAFTLQRGGLLLLRHSMITTSRLAPISHSSPLIGINWT